MRFILILLLSSSLLACSSHSYKLDIGNTDSPAAECVILLHGLARTSNSMRPMEKKLLSLQYLVINVDYPSRQFTVEEMASKAIEPALNICRQHHVSAIHFVTHSLGGILVRQYLHENNIPELQKVVMLAPPNKGSQVVDNLKSWSIFRWMNGPAASELGTDEKSLPNKLGEANFDLGIIAGERSINWLLSLYLPNPDDGKVSVENTKLQGMKDFISLPVTHPFIMKNDTVIAQVLHYLKLGHFDHNDPSQTGSHHQKTATN